MVTAPTPPGTGVAMAAFPDTASKSISPQSFPSGVTLMPTSTATAPSRTWFPPITPAFPAADRVLADVPCSGLGILGKKPDIRYKTLDEARRRELLDTQRAILDCAARYLKPGGRLVYSTCTIHPDENQEQVKAFLARRPDFRVIQPEAAFPEGMEAGPYGALSVPGRVPAGMDGFFICVMRRDG